MVSCSQITRRPFRIETHAVRHIGRLTYGLECAGPEREFVALEPQAHDGDVLRAGLRYRREVQRVLGLYIDRSLMGVRLDQYGALKVLSQNLAKRLAMDGKRLSVAWHSMSHHDLLARDRSEGPF